MTNEPNRFEMWAEKSKELKKQFAKGSKFARGEMRDINERVASRKQDIEDGK